MGNECYYFFGIGFVFSIDVYGVIVIYKGLYISIYGRLGV